MPSPSTSNAAALIGCLMPPAITCFCQPGFSSHLQLGQSAGDGDDVGLAVAIQIGDDGLGAWPKPVSMAWAVKASAGCGSGADDGGGFTTPAHRQCSQAGGDSQGLHASDSYAIIRRVKTKTMVYFRAGTTSGAEGAGAGPGHLAGRLRPAGWPTPISPRASRAQAISIEAYRVSWPVLGASGIDQTSPTSTTYDLARALQKEACSLTRAPGTPLPNESDRHHSSAPARFYLAEAPKGRLLTTHLIVAEPWTLLCAHLGRAVALKFWDTLRTTRMPVMTLDPVDLRGSLDALAQAFPDQAFQLYRLHQFCPDGAPRRSRRLCLRCALPRLPVRTAPRALVLALAGLTPSTRLGVSALAQGRPFDSPCQRCARSGQGGLAVGRPRL